MGGNRRYPDLSARLADERELKEARERGPLQTLTEEQLRLHVVPVTVVPERTVIEARAWVRFGDADLNAAVRIRRWTDDAIGVELGAEGETQRCWVWRGAVTFGE